MTEKRNTAIEVAGGYWKFNTLDDQLFIELHNSVMLKWKEAVAYSTIVQCERMLPDQTDIEQWQVEMPFDEYLYVIGLTDSEINSVVSYALQHG